MGEMKKDYPRFFAMIKWMMGLLAVCSLSLLAVEYDAERIVNDFAKLFKLETFEYDGEKSLSVVVNQTSDSEYGDLLKQFSPYIAMINQLAETHKMCSSLNGLGPAEAEAALMKQLREHPLLKKELLPLMARYLKAKGHSVNAVIEPRLEYNMEMLLPIAARFFYPHLVNDKFRLHICVGINGLKTLNPEPPAALAAFSFQAISKGLAANRPDTVEFVDHINKKWQEKDGQDIQVFQKEIWQWLEIHPKLKGLLWEEYEQVKDTLPFILKAAEEDAI
jgi:hypothetical protein